MKKQILVVSGLALSAFALHAEPEVTFYAPGIVRIVRNPTGAAVKKLYPIVSAEPGDVAVKVERGEGKTTWRSSSLSVVCDSRSEVLSFLSDKGEVLLEEAAAATFSDVTYEGNRKTTRVVQRWRLGEDRPVYGLGSVQNGLFDQRHWKGLLRPENLDDGLPCLCGVEGWAVYWDNVSPTRYQGDKDGIELASDVGTHEDYYFIAGGSLDGAVRGLRHLTGQVPMNALWSYGFWQSRERYVSQEQLLGVLRDYRRLGIPLDGIVQDWQYWGDGRHWNALEFLSPQFPDPKAMIDEVHRRHARFILSVWCAFGSETKPYRDLAEIGALLDLPTWPPLKDSGAKPYDVYNPAAREIYWRHAKRLCDLGLDGWWMDSTEPEPVGQNDAHNDIPCHLGHYRDVRLAYPISAVEWMATQTRRERPDRRPFILTRSASMGQQRTGAHVWSGDVPSTWESLAKQVPCGLNFSLCGNPNWSTDLGGFFANKLPKEEFPELYVRWMQYGVFQPLMRSHGTCRWREINLYGKPGEPVYDSLLASVKLRYRLLPYIYSLAHDVTAKGGSFLRPLAAEFPEDRATWDEKRSFLSGRNLLVSPVTKPGAKTWSVRLPTGADWYDYFSGRVYRGGQTAEVAVSLGTFPLFVRAGTVLVTGPDVQYVGEKPWDYLEVRVYPGANGSFVLYEDAGDGFGYEKGEFTEIPMIWDDKRRTLSIGKRTGSYPGLLKERRFRVGCVGEDLVEVRYDGTEFSISLSEKERNKRK